MSFRPDIQGLRAIAVLSVIIFHINPAWLPGGFVGVDIFLVISGFLISSILLHRKSSPAYSAPSTLIYFYSSRLKRIVPAYLSTLVLVSFFAAIFFIPTDFSIYLEGLKKALYFNSNTYFANFGNYFAPSSYEQPLLHTWSLAVEVQFYLVAPLIFLLLPKKWLYVLLPAAIILLTAYAEYRLQAGIQQATYYSLAARIPAFLAGAYVTVLMSSPNRLRFGDNLKMLLSILAIALIAVAFINPKPEGHFPGVAGLVPVLGASLIIWLDAKNRVNAWFSCKSMVWIGALSYSLYLWHWPVLAFMRYYSGAEILPWTFILGCIVLTIGLAMASYYWIETPLRLKRSRAQLKGCACLALVAIATAIGIKKVNVYATPEALPPEYTRYADSALICHGQIVDDCLKGDLNSDKEVLVLGDSHAAMLNLFFDQLGKELGFKARIITASSCVTIPGFDYQRIAEWAQADCRHQIKEASSYIGQAEIIYIAGMWSWQFQGEKFQSSIESFLSSGAPHAKKYILSQVPLLNRNPMRGRRLDAMSLNHTAEHDESYLLANYILEDIAKKYSGVTYVKLNHLRLFDTAPVYDGSLTYYDENHMNEKGISEYARQAKGVFKSLLEQKIQSEIAR
ncbi:acyltransferase [Pseudomonas sp. MM211]|uniref:acyltransferase family protein n=1 Tax=Pseudomonas sp. MM211 TaxID=2866808 RepID=UPI001CEDEA36|nr:acyltransferase family protein [Pseudomonas sp. MM211]UCJ15185.1 acyltransferase [Pseudomonas sp. MM211]